MDSEQQRLLKEIRRLVRAIVRESERNPVNAVWTYRVDPYDART